MGGMSSIRFGLLAFGLVLAVAAVACNDDGGDSAGSTAGSTAVGGEPTSMQGPQSVPIGTSGTGGGSAGNAGPGSPPRPAPGLDEPPATTATAGGQTVETGIGTFCWTTMCVDKIGVPTKGVLTVFRGDTVTIAVPDSAPALREASANVFEATESQQLDDGSTIWLYSGAPGEEVASEVKSATVDVKVDLAPGRYVLAVGMFFETGDVVYGVLLDVR